MGFNSGFKGLKTVSFLLLPFITPVVNTGRFIMYSGITKLIIGKPQDTYLETVANATVAKHTDVHIPARRRSRPLPL